MMLVTIPPKSLSRQSVYLYATRFQMAVNLQCLNCAFASFAAAKASSSAISCRCGAFQDQILHLGPCRFNHYEYSKKLNSNDVVGPGRFIIVLSPHINFGYAALTVKPTKLSHAFLACAISSSDTYSREDK